MAAHPATPFTPAQEARIREIVAEMIGQWSAGSGRRLTEFAKMALSGEGYVAGWAHRDDKGGGEDESAHSRLDRAIADRLTTLDELTQDVRLDTDFERDCARRLECLRLATATLHGERADTDIVQRAAGFYDFISGTTDGGADA